jgi:small subunit ribosomal protein S15
LDVAINDSTISRIEQIKKMLDKKSKEKIIKKFRVHETDTGSPQVQIAILTEEIKELTEHLKKHKHDFSSRRGLLKKVGERRKLLKYLQRENVTDFQELAVKLKLKIAQKMQEEEEEERKKDKNYAEGEEILENEDENSETIK